MALNFRRLYNGLQLIAKSILTSDSLGDLEVSDVTKKIYFHNGTTNSPLLTEDQSGPITNKLLIDNSVEFANVSDNTKLLNISLGGATTGTETTLVSSQTANRSLTLPNVTDTLTANAATQTLTNKTLSGNTSSNFINGAGTLNLNSTGTITVPNGTDTLTGNTLTQTLTNKTLTSPQINSPSIANQTNSTEITLADIATPSTPSAGNGKIYFKSDGFLYQLNDSGTETKVGAGSGGINYITNPDAESGTSGWSTYANSAANIPSSGTGGTATGLTFSSSNSSPLRGTKSFLLQQANSTSLQGKGVSCAFTIDPADKTAPLQISFNYNASSTFVAADGVTPPLNDGTTSTNTGNSDIEVFIYDVTNSQLIVPTPQVIVANGSNNFSYSGEFQAASNSISYRLILHCATTSANSTGYQFKFDDVSVGPTILIMGSPITDWLSYTPSTFNGFGTVTTQGCFYKRVGDSMELSIFFKSGVSSGATAYITLPSGINIDINKLALSGGLINLLGTGSVTGGGTGNPYIAGNGLAIVYSTTTGTNALAITRQTDTDASGSTYALNTGANVANTGSQISFNAKIPVSGWGSNMILSNDTDTRIVTAKYFIAGSNGTDTSTPVRFDTKVFDTHSAVTTGAGWRFTAPISGYYQISATFSPTTASTTNYSVYKNGISNTAFMDTTNANTYRTGSTILLLTSGDYIDIRSGQSVTTTGSTDQSISIERLSGPATIAASETVACSVTGNPASASTGNPIIFPSKLFDTHNSYSTSTGFYTVPISGKYAVSGYISAGSNANVLLTAVPSTSTTISVGRTDNTIGFASLSGILALIAGETLKLTGDGTMDVSAGSYFHIYRIGN